MALGIIISSGSALKTEEPPRNQTVPEFMTVFRINCGRCHFLLTL